MVAQNNFKMPLIKDYEEVELSDGGIFRVLQQPDSFDSILEFEEQEFRLSEFSHVPADGNFKIHYELNDGASSYPVSVDLTLDKPS